MRRQWSQDVRERSLLHYQAPGEEFHGETSGANVQAEAQEFGVGCGGFGQEVAACDAGTRRIL